MDKTVAKKADKGYKVQPADLLCVPEMSSTLGRSELESTASAVIGWCREHNCWGPFEAWDIANRVPNDTSMIDEVHELAARGYLIQDEGSVHYHATTELVDICYGAAKREYAIRLSEGRAALLILDSNGNQVAILGPDAMIIAICPNGDHETVYDRTDGCAIYRIQERLKRADVGPRDTAIMVAEVIQTVDLGARNSDAGSQRAVLHFFRKIAPDDRRVTFKLAADSLAGLRPTV